MKTAIIFLAVVSCTFALSCFKGAGISESAKLTEKETCDAAVTTCKAPKAEVDSNDFMDYGCGTCDDATKCATCTTDDCNTFVAVTKFAQKCYSSATEKADCTGLSAAGCYTVLPDYTGEHAALKGKYGGCGKCDDALITPALTADELKFCKSCDGAECNGAGQATFALASIIAALAFYL